jgi:hypothetical protein
MSWRSIMKSMVRKTKTTTKESLGALYEKK